MVRLLTFPILLVILICVGCGGQGDSASSSVAASNVSSTHASASEASPTDVVSQFLDEVRRGGANSNAGNLLTVKAQEELDRIGLSVQPIGSPAARFEVTRGEAVPGEPDAMLVHSLWTEPSPDGSNSQFQVVWAVQRESAGWRISGMAMELQPGKPPTVIDFENGNLMAQTLAPQPAQPAAGAATAPTANSAASGTTPAATIPAASNQQLIPSARETQAANPATQMQLK